jgi:hypothetical protein
VTDGSITISLRNFVGEGIKIFQVSIDTGDLPKDWRDVNISSIFKKGDKHLPENYRPVSLTSVPCKLLSRTYNMQTSHEISRN